MNQGAKVLLWLTAALVNIVLSGFVPAPWIALNWLLALYLGWNVGYEFREYRTQRSEDEYRKALNGN